VKAGSALLAELLLAVLAGCSVASAGEVAPFAAPAAASDDTPARRTPAMPATPHSKQDTGADPGGAILNPLSPVPAPVTNSASPPAPPDASVTTTVIASLAAIAAIAYLLHKLLS
jgi:hypothetical protein